MQKFRGRLTFANVISCFALFVALGGVSYAATQLPSNSVGSKQLRKEAVAAGKIKEGAVTAGKIKSEAVNVEKLQNGAVGTSKLADGAVTTNKLGDAAVTTAKLADGDVTAGKLALSPYTAEFTISAPSGSSNHELSCPAGTRMLSGGILNENQNLVLLGSHPNNENTWRVSLFNTTGTPINYAMVVTCIEQ